MHKKFLVLTAGAMLLAGTQAFAAATLTFPITVTVIATSIDISGNNGITAGELAARSFGAVGAGIASYSNGGTDNAIPYIQVQNIGYSELQLGLRQTAPAGWTALASGSAGTAAGLNNYRLSAVFTNYFGNATSAAAAIPGATTDDWAALSSTSFQANDVVPTGATPTYATATLFFDDARTFLDANKKVDMKGEHVRAGLGALSQRTIRLALDAPAAGSANEGTNQSISMFVDARVQP